MSQRLVTFIEKLPEALNGDGIEAKQLCIKFTLNNVASCAFGVEGKCFEEPDSKFQDLARRFFSADSVQMLKVYLIFQFPFLTKIFTPKYVINKSTSCKANQILDLYQKTLKMICDLSFQQL